MIGLPRFRLNRQRPDWHLPGDGRDGFHTRLERSPLVVALDAVWGEHPNAIADGIGGGRGAASLVAIQVGAGTPLLAGLALGPGSAILSILLLLGVGIRVVGSTGVFYSTMTATVETEEISAATAGGQTIKIGGFVGPPAFGFLADTVGYEAGWALLAGVALIATLLFVALRLR